MADHRWRRLGNPRDVYVRPEEDVRIDVTAQRALLVLSGTIFDEFLRRAPGLRAGPRQSREMSGLIGLA